ncbi:hypothetical protein EON77_14585, partial [bacterium]
MADPKTKGAASASARPAKTDDELAAEAASERALTTATNVGLPVVTFVGALCVGVATSAGPAILVLAGGTLLGVIMLLWTSLRTLTGDAPLEPALALAMAESRTRAWGSCRSSPRHRSPRRSSRARASASRARPRRARRRP